MAAPPDDAPARLAHDVLGPASNLARRRLGMGLIALTALAVVLAAGGAPVALRGPAVLVSATLLPGYPLVARLPVDLPTLLALDICVSLAIEAGLAFLLVQSRLWYPMGLGLTLAVVGVGAALATVTALRAQAGP